MFYNTPPLASTKLQITGSQTSVLQYNDHRCWPTDGKILWSKALGAFCFCTNKTSPETQKQFSALWWL